MTPQRLKILNDYDFAELDEFDAMDDFGSLDDFGADELDELSNALASNPAKPQLPCQVFTSWVDGPRSVSHLRPQDPVAAKSNDDFFLVIDESHEVGGTNLGPSPQEVVLAALNTFVVNTFAEGCQTHGIRLEKVEVTSSGKLDLRGFFGLNQATSLDYKSLNWTLAVKGDATFEEFQQVLKTSFGIAPNAWNLVVMF
ncbi:MAG: OsmC family protein [Cyanobacteria bacterium P01_F01_bin.86]